MARSKSIDIDVAIVFPVAGAFLNGVPAVPTTTSPDIAERLVRTGAFTYDAPEIADGETHEISVSELPDGALAALDHYDPIEPAEAEPAPEADPQPETPAEPEEN